MIEIKRLERTIVTCTLCPRLVKHRLHQFREQFDCNYKNLRTMT